MGENTRQELNDYSQALIEIKSKLLDYQTSHANPDSHIPHETVLLAAIDGLVGRISTTDTDRITLTEMVELVETIRGVQTSSESFLQTARVTRHA
jgi:hypothetical protein